MWTIRRVGIDQLLFGSDYPIYNQTEAIEAVRRMGFTHQEEEKIFYGNANGFVGNSP